MTVAQIMEKVVANFDKHSEALAHIFENVDSFGLSLIANFKIIESLKKRLKESEESL